MDQVMAIKDMVIKMIRKVITNLQITMATFDKHGLACHYQT